MTTVASTTTLEPRQASQPIANPQVSSDVLALVTTHFRQMAIVSHNALEREIAARNQTEGQITRLSDSVFNIFGNLSSRIDALQTELQTTQQALAQEKQLRERATVETQNWQNSYQTLVNQLRRQSLENTAAIRSLREGCTRIETKLDREIAKTGAQIKSLKEGLKKQREDLKPIYRDFWRSDSNR